MIDDKQSGLIFTQQSFSGKKTDFSTPTLKRFFRVQYRPIKADSKHFFIAPCKKINFPDLLLRKYSSDK